jgi:hypothetical protein
MREYSPTRFAGVTSPDALIGNQLVSGSNFGFGLYITMLIGRGTYARIMHLAARAATSGPTVSDGWKRGISLYHDHDPLGERERESSGRRYWRPQRSSVVEQKERSAEAEEPKKSEYTAVVAVVCTS